MATVALVGPRGGRIGQSIGRVWRPLITMRTAVILTLMLAAFALTGTLVAQVPSDIEAGSRTYAAWVESLQPRYGGWTTLLERLQAFSIFTSVWFRATVTLLAISLIACSAVRSRRMWQRARHPSASMPAIGDERALQVLLTTALAPAAALEQVGADLRRRRFRVTVVEGTTSMDLAAVRFGWAPFGSVVAHLSILVIIVGAIVGAALGFHEPRVSVPIGTSVEVGHGTGLTLQATGFSDLYYPDGSPRDYASRLVLTRGGSPVAQADVRVNEPLRYGDISIYQSYFGAAASMRISDAGGSTLFSGLVPLELATADGRHVVGRITLGGGATTVFVVAPASGQLDPAIRPGQMEVRIVGPRDPTNATIRVLSQGNPAVIDDLTVTFVRDARFTGLIVARDPGRALVWGGAVLLLVGLLVALALHERRAWATARIGAAGTEIRLATTPGRNSDGDVAAFHRMTTEIGAALDVGCREERSRADAEVV